MKLLRRLVAVILLLSTLIALSSCAPMSIKQNRNVKNAWNELITKENAISIKITNPYVYGAPSQAIVFDKIKTESYDEAFEILGGIGDYSFEDEIIASGTAGEVIFLENNNYKIAIRLYDDGIVISDVKTNKSYNFKTKYDKNIILSQLKELVEITDTKEGLLT